MEKKRGGEGGEGVWERVIPEEEHLFVGVEENLRVVGILYSVQVGGGGNDYGVHGRSLWRGRPGFFSAS